MCRETQREDGERLIEPFAPALGRAGMLRLQALREIHEQPLGRLDVGTLVGAAQNRLRPRPLPVVEISISSVLLSTSRSTSGR